jgi:Double zinc ribbon
MRTCAKCMTPNIDTARVCQQCGSPLQQSGGKTCPSGRHTMDPTWTECVYCRQENAGPSLPSPPPLRTPTVFEGQKPTEVEGRRTPLPPRRVNSPSPVPPPQSAGPKPETPMRPRDRTVFGPVPSGGQAAPPVTKNRRIVGILITYSWNPEGKIFPILEGRNFIGRDQDCEVSVPEDETMSGHNSHITYRQSFVVGDLVSMTGTDLDGAPIEEQFHSLGNYATIRAGSTYFTFIAVKPPASAVGPEPTPS